LAQQVMEQLGNSNVAAIVSQIDDSAKAAQLMANLDNETIAQVINQVNDNQKALELVSAVAQQAGQDNPDDNTLIDVLNKVDDEKAAQIIKELADINTQLAADLISQL